MLRVGTWHQRWYGYSSIWAHVDKPDSQWLEISNGAPRPPQLSVPDVVYASRPTLTSHVDARVPLPGTAFPWRRIKTTCWRLPVVRFCLTGSLSLKNKNKLRDIKEIRTPCFCIKGVKGPGCDWKTGSLIGVSKQGHGDTADIGWRTEILRTHRRSLCVRVCMYVCVYDVYLCVFVCVCRLYVVCVCVCVHVCHVNVFYRVSRRQGLGSPALPALDPPEQKTLWIFLWIVHVFSIHGTRTVLWVQHIKVNSRITSDSRRGHTNIVTKEVWGWGGALGLPVWISSCDPQRQLLWRRGFRSFWLCVTVETLWEHCRYFLQCVAMASFWLLSSYATLVRIPDLMWSGYCSDWLPRSVLQRIQWRPKGLEPLDPKAVYNLAWKTILRYSVRAEHQAVCRKNFQVCMATPRRCPPVSSYLSHSIPCRAELIYGLSTSRAKDTKWNNAPVFAFELFLQGFKVADLNSGSAGIFFTLTAFLLCK